MNQDLLRAILGGSPEVAEQRSRDPVGKTCRDGSTATTRLRGPEEAEERLRQAGSTTLPKHHLS